LIPVDALLAEPLAHVWDKPVKASALAPSGHADLDRARALAKRLPPSVEGHGGDAALFRAANELSTVLGEDVDAVLVVLAETFNPRCMPQWDQVKLRREAERAAGRQATPEARMRRRRDEAREVDPFHPPDEIGADHLALDATKFGTPRTTVTNVCAVLGHVLGDRVRYEECAGRIVCQGIDPSLGYFPDGEWSDGHTTAAVMLCEGLRLYVQAATVDRALELHARGHAYNLLSDGLKAMSETWDGSPRVDSFFSRYFGADDTDATTATSRVFLLSLAARGLVPGEKVDTCPILIGAQGIKKSSGLAALVGREFFADSPLPLGDKEAAQMIRGKWLWEFGEHVAISKKERNSVKAFLSQQSDRFRASYGRHTQDVARTCTFVSSSNDDEVLNDPTGARRFLPVRVRAADLGAIERDRVQILGEAAWRWLHGEAIEGDRSSQGGEPHWPSVAETIALGPTREDVTQVDTWQDLIEDWIGDKTSFTMAEVLDHHTGAVHMTEDRIDKGVEMRVGAALRSLGWARTRKSHGGRQARVWVRI
jgi:hypothetical protein